jgi:hypothetical protein
MAETGHMAGMVLLHTNEGIMALPYKDGSMPVGMQQMVIIGIVKACVAAGRFEGLVLVSEAWMAKQTSPEIAGVLPPAQDPDRQEVIVAWAYGQADGDKRMTTADIIRSDGSVTIGEPMEHSSEEVGSWLDDAFAK